MQTTIDIPEAQLEALHALSKARNQTPEDLIRQAVVNLLTEQPPTPRRLDGFGAWGDHVVDGLEYQIAIRKEWDREWDPD